MNNLLWYKKFMPYLSLIVRILWYLILITLLTIYVFQNWCTMVRFTFPNSFDGNNLLFITWIILLLFPLFSDFEGFGIKFKLWRQHQNQTEKEVPAAAVKEILINLENNAYDNKPEEIIGGIDKKLKQLEQERGSK